MKKTIGILYLCTGPYRLFWDEFYDSFEKNFLLDTEKHYFVFSDALGDLEPRYGKSKNVTLIHIDAMPWPLVTLLRFRYFISIEEQLSQCEYLMFSNANIACEQVVTEEEFLPRKSQGEKLSFVKHPGYWNKASCCCPLERRRRSLAYVPYNSREPYVIGAMFAGEGDAFLRMSRVLRDRIEVDLKDNTIARWHDESHLNRYIVGRTDNRFLPPAYCYPWGFDLPLDRKIVAVSKEAKFDVVSFKSTQTKKMLPGVFIKKAFDKIALFGYIRKFRDLLLLKSLDIL